MIGNDIVDLRTARQQSNWSRKNYLDKVFHSDEIELILTAKNQDRVQWLLWSMKEASYKAHQRRYDLPRRINWKNQHCVLFECTSSGAAGIVHISGEIFQTRSYFEKEWLHTIAAHEVAPDLYKKVITAPMKSVKRDLIERIAGRFEVPEDALFFKKNSQGIPSIYYRNNMIFESFSLSDHGRFSACSAELMNCKTSVKHY